MIQYCDKQSALYVFQKYRFCEDYTNLLWAQMFLLGFLETNLGKFKHFRCQNLQVSVMFYLCPRKETGEKSNKVYLEGKNIFSWERFSVWQRGTFASLKLVAVYVIFEWVSILNYQLNTLLLIEFCVAKLIVRIQFFLSFFFLYR